MIGDELTTLGEAPPCLWLVRAKFVQSISSNSNCHLRARHHSHERSAVSSNQRIGYKSHYSSLHLSSTWVETRRKTTRTTSLQPAGQLKSSGVQGTKRGYKFPRWQGCQGQSDPTRNWMAEEPDCCKPMAGLTSRGVWLASRLLSSARCQTSWIPPKLTQDGIPPTMTYGDGTAVLVPVHQKEGRFHFANPVHFL